MAATKEDIQLLETKLNAAVDGLKAVKGKKMFGCHALWANENVFALVWKHGRIGVKLPDESAYEKLMGVAGAEPWKAGAMVMSKWVLVPESFHKKSAALGEWTKRAHELALSAEPKKKAAPKTKKVTKKN